MRASARAEHCSASCSCCRRPRFSSSFLTYPLGLGVWLGFTDTQIGRPRHLRRPGELRVSSGTTASSGSLSSTRILYTVVASILKFALGLWLALILNENLPFKAFFRAIVLLPWVVPTVLSAIAFWWIYDAQFSIISWSLMELGLIDQPHQLPRRPDQCARLRHRGERLARHSVRRDHAARRPADDPAVALRGGDARRRHAAGSGSAM